MAEWIPAGEGMTALNSTCVSLIASLLVIAPLPCVA